MDLDGLLGGIQNTLQGITAPLINLYDAGSNIFNGIKNRIDALNQIDSETVKDASSGTTKPAVTFEVDVSEKLQKTINITSLVLIAVGILVVILIFKRKAR
jgi:hypothetical protein